MPTEVCRYQCDFCDRIFDNLEAAIKCENGRTLDVSTMEVSLVSRDRDNFDPYVAFSKIITIKAKNRNGIILSIDYKRADL
jgi:hypothetical protein